MLNLLLTHEDLLLFLFPTVFEFTSDPVLYFILSLPRLTLMPLIKGLWPGLFILPRPLFGLISGPYLNCGLRDYLCEPIIGLLLFCSIFRSKLGLLRMLLYNKGVLVSLIETFAFVWNYSSSLFTSGLIRINLIGLLEPLRFESWLGASPYPCFVIGTVLGIIAVKYSL